MFVFSEIVSHTRADPELEKSCIEYVSKVSGHYFVHSYFKQRCRGQIREYRILHVDLTGRKELWDFNTYNDKRLFSFWCDINDLFCT